MTVDQFHEALRAQGTHNVSKLVFICPMCRTPQTANDLILAGAGRMLEDVDKYLGFSCIGRFMGAPAPRKKPDGKPCNWTLGGLLKTHKLEVVTPDGERHPRFEVATPEQVKEYWATRRMRIYAMQNNDPNNGTAQLRPRSGPV